MRGIDWQTVVEELASGFERISAALELEQAVVGLDGQRELALHALIERCLLDAGYGVTRERRFPSERTRKRSAGRRCDFVLTRDGRPLAADGPTELFNAVDPATDADAGWFEVKLVAQHRPHAGADYSQRLQGPVWKDVTKLARDPGIHDAAVLLVLFTADDAIASHDLSVWARRASERGLALWPRRERAFDIGDRLGNRRCRLAVFPLERPPR